MSEFLNLKKVYLPFQCIETVYKHLRRAGGQGVEAVALWAGHMEQTDFYVSTTLIPKQTAFKSESGLSYDVDSEELHRINVWLYENKLSLIAQIHSHPSEAYHSEMDDEYPIITAFGGISIVVPDFAFRAFSIEDWAVYRYMPEDGWAELSIEVVKNLLVISS